MSMNDILLIVLSFVSNTALAAAFIIHLILSRRERRDLYNRLMSADIGDYMRLSEKETPKKEVRLNAHKKAIAAFHTRGIGAMPE